MRLPNADLELSNEALGLKSLFPLFTPYDAVAKKTYEIGIPNPNWTEYLSYFENPEFYKGLVPFKLRANQKQS